MRKLLLPAACLLAGFVQAQQIVVPAGQAFVDNGVSGITWRSTLFHFQMMYDNAAFTAAGITGPITINRLRFRAADSFPNLGGQVFSGVTVQFSDTPTTSATVFSGAAGPAASTATAIAASGLIAGQFASGTTDLRRCFSLTFTSGANIGLTRVISASTATSITVSLAFPAAPAIGDTYDIVRAPITFDNMAQSFAANVGVNVGASEVFASVPVAAAAGTTPNTYVIDLTLGASAFIYDPTTMGNLMLDVNSPAAPAPNATSINSFACSSQAVHRARRNSTGTAGASVGALSDFASVILMDFTGPGGSSTAALGAKVVSIGGGCNGQSPNVNQYFNLEDFDLRGSPANSITLTPDSVVAPTNYIVTSGTTAVDLTQATGPVAIADESVTAHVLATNGWLAPFAFPGGTTTQLTASSNGFVWLATNTLADFSPTIAEWLGGAATNLPARVAPAWHDWHAGRNTATHPGSGVYVSTDTTGGPGNAVTYVTWKEIGQFDTAGGVAAQAGGLSVNTFQAVFAEATGVVELRYGAMAAFGGNVLSGGPITGFTRGTMGAGVNCTDSGSRDLSHTLPYVTNGPNGPQGTLLLTTSARPVIGTSTTFTANNIPAGDIVGAFMYDVVPYLPGAPFPGLTEPTCILNMGFSPDFGFAVVLPTGPTQVSPSFPGPFGAPTYPLSFIGVTFYVQFASAPTAVGLFHTSNTLACTLGNL